MLAVAAALIALFLHNVDLRRVAADILRARPEWLAVSLATMFVNLAIRTLRWRYLLEPLGPTSFARAFRATAVGFAASSVLPARAGEVIRPYFLARQTRRDPSSRVTATGAFATIILERLIDVITVLTLLASYVFVFGRDLGRTNPSLFAALNVATGEVLGKCYRRHRHQEFLKFLNEVDARLPKEPGVEVHIILDNYGTHKTPAVKRWFQRHPEYHLHFTPTSGSWLNQVERFFAELTERQIRRGVFRSVAALVAAILEYLEKHNEALPISRAVGDRNGEAATLLGIARV